AYEEAFRDVFTELDALEALLDDDRTYVLGEALTETDIRLFVTLVRFDAAYHGLFNTNLKRIADSPRLQAWMERFYAVPGVAETVNIS
ncbi:glutathione S-transferase C-terminal domain-containing protein, partial [Acinetobacter baumannii]